MCAGADVATRADLREIFGHEKFTLLYHVRDISEHDWAAAAVHPCREVSRSQHLRDSLVDPGHERVGASKNLSGHLWLSAERHTLQSMPIDHGAHGRYREMDQFRSNQSLQLTAIRTAFTFYYDQSILVSSQPRCR